MNILVTGATGFVGRQLLETLGSQTQATVVAAIRSNNNTLSEKVKTVTVGDLGPDNSWYEALDNIDTIIHTAARVHVMNDDSKDPLSEFRKVNVEGTLNLARQAAKTGVKRFVFLSSIKVNGESTSLNLPFTEDDLAAPIDPYGISKYETEVGLFKLADETGMEVVSIRPTLVYGPSVKANFFNMMKWLYRGLPLPFGLIKNKRSLVALDNLVDLIITCTEHPKAANQVFLVSDGEDLSTSDLLRRVAKALDKTAYLLPVNQKLLEILLSFLGKRNLAQRLCGSLQVDISKAKKVLNWVPPISVDEGLIKTTQHFIGTKN